MVVASASGDHVVSCTTEKLRRSRRLSSTRGLKPRPACERAALDLNQKLGLCPIVSGKLGNDSRGGSLMDWEVNERISLSSGSSAGLEVRTDAKKGIEVSENRGRLDHEIDKSDSLKFERNHNGNNQENDKSEGLKFERNYHSNNHENDKSEGLKFERNFHGGQNIENKDCKRLIVENKRIVDNRERVEIDIKRRERAEFEDDVRRVEGKCGKWEMKNKKIGRVEIENGVSRVEDNCEKLEVNDKKSGIVELENSARKIKNNSGKQEVNNKKSGRAELEKSGIKIEDNCARVEIDINKSGKAIFENGAKTIKNNSARLEIDIKKTGRENLDNNSRRVEDNYERLEIDMKKNIKPDLEKTVHKIQDNHARLEVDIDKPTKSDLETKNPSKTHFQNTHIRIEERSGKPEAKDSRPRPDLESNSRRTEEARVKTDPRSNGTKIDTKRDLGLMNVSGFPRGSDAKFHRGSWEVEIDVIERRQDENILKSDSKYEIGVPSQTTKSKQRRQLSGGATKSQKSGKNETNQTGRWSAAKEKVDKANDSISKRLELIHELNQKILANYERFQQRSKRGHSKESKDSLKEQTPKARGSLMGSKEEIYAEVKRRNRSKMEVDPQRCQDSLRQQKVDTNKFTFSKEYCQRLTSSKDRFDGSQRKRTSRNQTISRVSRDNENFSMATKPEFSPREENKICDRLVESKPSESTSLQKEISARRSVFYTDQQACSKKIEEMKSLEENVNERENLRRNLFFNRDNEICKTKESTSSESKTLDKISSKKSVSYTNPELCSKINQETDSLESNEISRRKSVFYIEEEFCPKVIKEVQSAGLKSTQNESTKKNTESRTKKQWQLKKSGGVQSVESKVLQNVVPKVNSVFHAKQKTPETAKEVQTSKTGLNESPKTNSIFHAHQKLYSRKPKVTQLSESQIINKVTPVKESQLHDHQESVSRKEEKEISVSGIIPNKISNANVTCYTNQKFHSKKIEEVEPQESKIVHTNISSTKSSFHTKDFSLINHSPKSSCLNNSNLYPESFMTSGFESTRINVTNDPKLTEEMSEIQDGQQIIEVHIDSDSKSVRFGKQDERSLENEILDNLDETIGRFDSEKTTEGGRFDIEKFNEENRIDVEQINKEPHSNIQKTIKKHQSHTEKINARDPFNTEEINSECAFKIIKSSGKSPLTIQETNQENPLISKGSNSKGSFVIEETNQEGPSIIEKSIVNGPCTINEINKGGSCTIESSNGEGPYVDKGGPLTIECSTGEGPYIDKTDVSGQEGSDSFSTDSIQSCSPSSAAKEANGQETFNSSWDSGVGVDVGTGSGWVRIHTGIESSLVYLTLDTTAKDVCRDMLLGADLSLFIQYGGEPGRRLSGQEKPLEIQDQFLQRLGYQEPTRRSRLGVDPELRHLIAFHVGPASPLPDLAGYSRCGYALVLKGLVFPQWKRRPLAVIGSRLFLYPACPDSRPEWMELGGGGGAVCYAPSRLGKLVLRITGFPRVTQQCHQSQQREGGQHRETRHLYLGFHHPWDRDLWKSWIKRATQLSSCPKTLDLNSGGLSRVPDSAIAFPAIEEIVLSQNQLTDAENNLSILHRFPKLQAVHLENNDLKKVPRELLELRGLTYLNLSDNKIEKIQADINQLVNLRDLILDHNGIKDLPAEIGELKSLRNISLVGNSLSHVPSFLTMRALTFSDVLPKGDNGKVHKDDKNNQNNLHKVNLRNNHLKGNIILGNYGNLTHLDVSENSIEKLDIGALHELRSIRCARNLLTELTICGRNLVSLIAGNNKLKKLSIEPIPTNLEHLDVSYNNLDALPEWTPDLPLLRALFASHNALTALPDRLLSLPSRLEVLHLPHNRLQALPPPRRPLNIIHLTLQGNALTALPMNFFANTEKMKVLNLSNNRLSELPYRVEGNKNRQGSHSLEKLYLTANCLTDTALDALARLTSLRILHIAYNTLDTLPESCIASWKDMEELVLSGNRLQYLPDNVANLHHLRVLRVHSNRLLTCPTFGKTTSLKVLDLAHNQLDRVNLATLVPPQLQFLDISCNTRLHVDPRQFQIYRSQRPISLVDVSGQNRPSLPSHPHQQDVVATEKSVEQSWRLGFSETAGSREKLYVSQVRMPSFCNVEGLFGIFDGGSNQEAPTALQEMIPRLLLEERTVRETSKEYLKYTLLSAHRELKEKGQRYGIDATLVHVVRAASQYGKGPTRYSLRVASSGEARAVLCRAAGPLTLAAARDAKSQLGNAAMFPLVVPDPGFEEVALEEDDEFVIVANRRVWEVLSVQEAVREARAEASPVLAAKRLQDLAQAYGAEDNLSIVVVRLTGPSTADMDQLMRELRHAVGKSRGRSDGGCSCACCVPPPAAHKPPGPCCCHGNEGFYLNGVLKNIVSRTTKAHNGSGRYFKNRRATQENESPPYRDDRSSPSGQSDQASDSTFKSRHPSSRVWSGSAASRATNKARQSVLMHENGTRKVSPCLPAQDDAASERSGALSEEQFRCWEYMLEQNTQLLFDKELDTLTRAPLRRSQSRSTPQLGSNLPFLSKRFGSARSFNPSLPRPPVVRFGSGRRLLNGGPNAAYFGSLQRLMPYNLEYDFAVIQERSTMDSLEQDASRMQQYWGVATTEL